MENKEIQIKMIPLDNLIDVLVSLYNNGVDYVDLAGLSGEGMDHLAISFTTEYMNEEHQDNFKYMEKGDGTDIVIDVNRKLSDEDLNDLV